MFDNNELWTIHLALNASADRNDAQASKAAMMDLPVTAGRLSEAARNKRAIAEKAISEERVAK